MIWKLFQSSGLMEVFNSSEVPKEPVTVRLVQLLFLRIVSIGAFPAELMIEISPRYANVARLRSS